MEWIIVGLGNPGKEYEGTRHNIGRDMLETIARKEGVTAWTDDAKSRARSAKSTLFGKKARLLLPDTYMNLSGRALKTLIPRKKVAEKLIVLQDELDLPLGSLRISFGSSSGGHRGIESIQQSLKTKDFTRIRIGVSPQTPGGKLKKPEQKKVVDFVLGTFRPAEEKVLVKTRKEVSQALELLLTESRGRAMTDINSR